MKEWCLGEDEVLGGDLRDLSHSHSSLCVCGVCVGGSGERGRERSDYQLRIQNMTHYTIIHRLGMRHNNT